MNSVLDKVSQLKTQRADHQLNLQCETFAEMSGAVGTIIPISLATPPSDITKRTKRLTEESLELATRTNETVAQLNSVIAGQAAELAQLRQCVLVLAKSSKTVEDNTTTMVDNIEVLKEDLGTVKKQTKKVIRTFDDITKEMNKIWREIIEDTEFTSEDLGWITGGRIMRTIMSFGTAGPEARAAAKKECYNHIKSLRPKRDRLEALYEYGVLHHSAQMAEWIKQDHGVLTVHKLSYTMLEAFRNDFLTLLHQRMLKARAL